MEESKLPWKYHVFLSFRGEDTRCNFTDHLYAALWRKGIITFRDEEEIERGKVIKQELPKAIEESLCAVVVISQNYASSTWCLEELQKILESKRVFGRVVFPIFYCVELSNIRHQTGGFAEAFQKHEAQFAEDKEKVQRWRDALSEVAGLSGYDCKNQHENEIIKKIVEELWRRLKLNLPPYNTDGLVGIDERIKYMHQILEIGLDGICFVGIWGMGGIGKTTLARLVFNQFCDHFDISCCLENIRENSSRAGGLLGLQMKLLYKLEIKNLEIGNLEQGKATIRNLLSQRKVLLLLDDVDHTRQLENLAGKKDWFGPGSRVIVTTRDMHPLKSHEVQFAEYEIKLLNTPESLELFRKKAFKRNEYEGAYNQFFDAVVRYAGGLPLALEVLGSHLCGRDVSIWEDALDKISRSPPKDILDTLKISYEGLEDNEKTIFLDIACLFKGWDKDKVTQILKNCGLNAVIGIEVLVERSLLTCCSGVLQMHDLLQEMGRNIVVQKSSNEIGKQTRLWCPRDIDKVLRENKGTEFVRGIVLGSHNYKGALLESNNYKAYWDANAFSKMNNLRVLIILHGLHLPYHLKCLSRSLKVLEWKQCPLKFLPLGVQLHELVDLKMHYSKIKQLWSGKQSFEMLKSIDLSYSKDLTQTSIFAGVPNLESLVLVACTNLVEVHQSVGQLKKLVVLNLKDCRNIKTLPSKLEMNTLKDFILSGCSKVRKLPEFGEIVEGLLEFDLRGCDNLVCLPNSICNLKSLRILNISGCSKISKLPENIGRNKALEELDLSETSICEVPASICDLENLKLLYFRRCSVLPSNSWCMPSLFGWIFKMPMVPEGLKLPNFLHFNMLRILDASYCNLIDGSIPDDLGCLSSLETLKLNGNNFVNLPTWCISNLHKLDCLELCHCPNLQSLPMLPSNVRQVNASNSAPMKPLPFFQLWKPIVSLYHLNLENRLRWLHLVIPGSDIPPWFDRQNYFSFSAHPSITVDIPPHCWSGNWWAIALCIVVEPQVASCMMEDSLQDYLLVCEVESPHYCYLIHLQPDPPNGTSKNFNCPHQIMMLWMASVDFIQWYPQYHPNQVNLKFNIQIFSRKGISRDWKLSKCRWCVVCDKDECKAVSEFDMPSNSVVTEILGENERGEVIASNAQANLEHLAKQRKIK